MNAHTPAFRPVLLAAVSALGLAVGPATAQRQVNTGNVLDANLQVGSGGNVPAGQIPDFRARNLLITGQVTDGRQFRGEVDYGAAGAFGGSLGSDDLFRFRADAVGSARSLSPFGNLAAGSTDLGGGTIILNNFFTPSAGGEVLSPGTVRTVVAADGGRAQTFAAGAGIGSINPEFIGTSALTSANQNLSRDGRLNYTANTLGRALDSEGRTLQVDANPLFGLRETAVDSGSVGTVEDPPAGYISGQRSDERFGTGRSDGSTGLEAFEDLPGATSLNTDPAGNTANAGNTRQARVQNGNDTRGTALDTRRTTGNAGLNPNTGNRLTSNSAVDPTAARDPFSGLPVSVQLGARLNPALATLNPANQSATAQSLQAQEAQRLDRLGESIFRPLDTTAAATGDNAYLDLLQKIRDDYRAEEGGDEAQRPAPQPGAAPDRRPGRPQWMDKLDSPTDEAIQRAEDSSRSAIASILRTQREDAVRDGRPINAEPNPDEVATTDAMTSLLNQLSYDLPRLETLQGQRKDRANRNFGLAEEAMAKGEFFNAVSLYEQLIRDAPGNPLARVGQIHAEMGAGMIRSAALHVRRLFEQHPELIATRYAENLLPPEDRFVWLRKELQRLIDDPQVNNTDPGIMLAYLGHQIESRQLVRYGLAVATETSPLDPLPPLLRSVWLGEAQPKDK